MVRISFAWIVLASTALAQDAGKVLRFAHTTNQQNMMEIAAVIRAVTELAGVSLDNANRAIALTGAAPQIEAAEWVFQELDRPAGAAPPATARVYKMEDPRGEGVVRVFFVANAGTPQQLQEAATCIRAAVEARLLFTYTDAAAIVIRGTEEQAAVSEWLLQQLDQAAVRPGSDVARERPIADRYGEGHLRVFFLANVSTDQSHQELAACVRSLLEIRRLFTNSRSRAIIARGTAAQMQAAKWLLGELDQPAAKPGAGYRASKVFLMPEDFREGVVRVFYAAHLASAQQMQSLATEVRAGTSARRVFTYNARRAIAVRGSANQIAGAEELIKAAVKVAP